jgi:exosortase/archaeosortase family protein
MGKTSRVKSTRRATGWWKDNLPIVKFAAAFLGLLTAFQLAYYTLVVPSDAFKAYLGVNSHAAAAILGLLGERVIATNEVLTSSFTMSIKSGCDGLQAMAILAIAVLVFPGGGRNKAVGMAGGVALLAILNLARLVSLFWTGVHFPNLFQTMHVHIWPAVLIVVALLYAVAWTARANRPAGAS